MQKKWIGILAAVLCLGMLTGCGSASVAKEKEPVPSVDTAVTDIVKLETEEVAQSEMPVTKPFEDMVSSVPEETSDAEIVESAAPAPAETPAAKPVESPIPVLPVPAEPSATAPAESTAPVPAETPVVKPVETPAPAPAETPAPAPAETATPAPVETPEAKPTESATPVPAETEKPVESAPASSNNLVKQNTSAVIDYSNTNDGYVTVKYTESTTKRLKVQVKGPATTYTYNLNQGEWTTFPLSDGNGSYQVKVLRNTTGNKYSLVLSVTHNVALKDEFAPFIRPNQYVNYTAGSKTVAKAAELTRNVAAPLDKVAAVYNYVVNNLTYDKVKAANATSGYLPVLDTVLAEKKGICFDYAALMTGMLRSQGIPCKLVIGYAGEVYHAWISVWTEETGWLDNAIFFDGTTWQRMDPTFASTGNQSAEIMEYIGNNANYSIKYLY